MTVPTLTCETCESEIDVAKDPRCVLYDPSGATEVICAGCRQRAIDRWLLEGEWSESLSQRGCEALREAYRIKRGWRA